MFECSCCGVYAPVLLIERDAGDWIVRCENCGAKNIFLLPVCKNVFRPIIQIVGWRE
jgi:uncharacterized Zn finger protein